MLSKTTSVRARALPALCRRGRRPRARCASPCPGHARGGFRTPLGLVLGGAAVVLALMVGLLAFISIERSEAAMAVCWRKRALR